MKGLSPLIATVFLIAFTVGVAGILSGWLTSFTKTTTSTVREQGELEIICNSGGITVSTLKYCSPRLSGAITNTGTISLGNITIQIFYANATNSKYYLSLSGMNVSGSAACCGNMTLLSGEKFGFNISIGGSDYDNIRVITNCTGRVTTEAKRGDVAAC